MKDLKRSFALILTLALLVAGVSCSDQPERHPDMAVKWKLMSNFVDNKSDFEARFTFHNTGSKEISGEGWILYFNMSPRKIYPVKSPQAAIIEHINGDWYKLTPSESFKIAAGDSLLVHFWGEEGIIKETDAPAGLYYAFTENDGKESGTAVVKNYTIEPFTTREQILRGPDDKVLMPTAERFYYENEGLSTINLAKLPKIVPSPVSITHQNGQFTISDDVKIFYDPVFTSDAETFQEQLSVLTGKKYAFTDNVQDATIRLRKEALKQTSDEAYQLTINQSGIEINANGGAGIFYGLQSLMALAPVESWKTATASLTWPFTQIEDTPRFGFRSIHIDVTRNFQTKETLLRMIDVLSFYKLNHILLYTADDEGWRVEIDGLPELTEISGHRKHVSGMKANALHPSYGSGPDAFAEGTYGSGFYTKADYIEILKYAHKRHIRIIPELNFPGHARAAIKAMEARYERLMKEGKTDAANEYRLIDPDDQSAYLSAQFYKDNVVDVTNESAYRFFEKVVDEFINMYKEAGLTLDIFHIGGDEVAEGAWTGSPRAQKLLQENPAIGDPKNLHAYFLRRIVPVLQKKNLTIHGWEEVALTKTPEGKYVTNPEFVDQQVVPYVWNNVYDPDLGNRLANDGYPLVLCNVTNFYFDQAYSNDPREPGHYWGAFVNTKSTWAFAPFNMFSTTFSNPMGGQIDFSNLVRMKPEARKNVIGVEAHLWAEMIKGRDMIEYATLPKLAGFAESAWSKERAWENMQDISAQRKLINQGWNVFANQLANFELPRLAYMNRGYNYRVPPPGAIEKNGKVLANTAFPGLEIRYTTDGQEPTLQSAIWQDGINSGTQVRLRAFDKSGKGSRIVELNVPQ